MITLQTTNNLSKTLDKHLNRLYTVSITIRKENYKMTHTVKYIIQSQCATTGRYDDTATYDNLPYAQIHYDALNINCRNRLAKIVSTKSQDVYTEIESNYI